MSTWISLS